VSKFQRTFIIKEYFLTDSFPPPLNLGLDIFAKVMGTRSVSSIEFEDKMNEGIEGTSREQFKLYSWGRNLKTETEIIEVEAD
jgi:hypothetical protein